MTVPPQLKRYQFMEQLGTSGQGRTFRAIDRETGSEVAVKVIRIGSLDGWKGFDLFERECDVLARLSHPGIPKFLDRYAVEDSGDFFLVMELIEGKPLSTVMSDGALEDEDLLDVLWKTLEILGYLHGRTPPVVHRDVKPQNLIRRRDGSIALIDFGGVRASLDTSGGSTMIGTFGYMAPEQLHGDATPATDLYALAATIAALGTGKAPDKLPHDGLRLSLGETRLKRSRLRPVLDRMLEPVPSRRLQTVANVREALRKTVHDDDAGAGANASASPRGPSRPPAGAALQERDPAGVARRKKIPPLARSMAKVPPPLNILVWMATAFGAGVFVVLEVAFFPLLYVLWKMITPRDERARLMQDRAETLGDVRNTRRALQYVADRTYPLRDETRKRLGSGDDDR